MLLVRFSGLSKQRLTDAAQLEIETEGYAGGMYFVRVRVMPGGNSVEREWEKVVKVERVR